MKTMPYLIEKPSQGYANSDFVARFSMLHRAKEYAEMLSGHTGGSVLIRFIHKGKDMVVAEYCDGKRVSYVYEGAA